MPALRTGVALKLSQAINGGRRLNVLVKVGMFVMLFLWFGSSSPARAQQVQFGIDFTTVIPTGDFSKNVTNNGYGVGAQFLVGLGPSQSCWAWMRPLLHTVRRNTGSRSAPLFPN